MIQWFGKHIYYAWKGKVVLNLFVFGALWASFTALNLGTLLVQNFSMVSHSWGTQVEMNVYLKPELIERGPLEKLISEKSMVQNVKFISQQQAIAGLQTQIASHAPDLMADLNLLQLIPPSLQIEFKTFSNRAELHQNLKSMADEIRARPEVEDVQYGLGWLEQFSAITRIITQVGWGSFALIFLGSVFMVTFIIRNSVHQRREEIEILELVGADAGYIRWPFVFEGALVCALAGALSLASAAWFFNQFQNTLGQEQLFSVLAGQLQSLGLWQIALFSFLFAVLGAVTSGLCVLGINSGFSAAEKIGASIE